MASMHIDEVILFDLKEVMEADFNRLISIYFDDSVLLLESLVQSLQSGDLPKLRKTAHSLKGSSSNIGAPRLAELLQELEDMAKQNELKHEVVLLDEIHNEFQLVRQSLLQWVEIKS